MASAFGHESDNVGVEGFGCLTEKIAEAAKEGLVFRGVREWVEALSGKGTAWFRLNDHYLPKTAQLMVEAVGSNRYANWA